MTLRQWRYENEVHVDGRVQGSPSAAAASSILLVPPHRKSASMDIAELDALPRVPVAHRFVDLVWAGHVERALRRGLNENYGPACSRVGRVRRSR